MAGCAPTVCVSCHKPAFCDIGENAEPVPATTAAGEAALSAAAAAGGVPAPSPSSADCASGLVHPASTTRAKVIHMLYPNDFMAAIPALQRF
ncbi:MAG: hypothetical protein WDN06_19940 [Asticcacaulis sp.]